ncbi:response regulator transcription factor [Rhodospirillum sp. A1_3_36]|uniref:response regulator transcription factor n=1 Tax=Rhodospirillum sp. A1_3_36 TaxID=3391666 RepID=UPI0039A5B06C
MTGPSAPLAALVYVVDDDEAMRRSLCWLLRSVGHECREYASADAFTAAFEETRPGCLLLDIRMPGQSGLDLLDSLNKGGATLPVLILTGHGDVPMAVRALKAGAMDFLEKPCNDQMLLDRVQEAVSEHARRLAEQQARSDARQRLDSLTARERQVAELVSRGLSNKAIARDLEISLKTVEVHRHNAMVKLKVEGAAELARLWVEAEEGS